MSRHSVSSSRRRNPTSRGLNGGSEELIEQTKSTVMLLNEVISFRVHEWEAYLDSARFAMTTLDRISFFREPHRFAEQVWFLNSLQDFAFHDSDTGIIQDIADWCQTAWLRVLRNYPENVEVLVGLGQNWVQRSQATIVNINREEGNDSSSHSSGKTSSGASPPADPHRQGPLYVEAQGYLQPAVEFYTRAVRSADSLRTTNGDLLASAAEAHMFLGNVSGPPHDERNLDHAIRYLRRAQAIPGYLLSEHLQQYLNEWGRYVY